MLIDFEIAAGTFLRKLYSDLYSDDDGTNRILTSSDEKRLLELAVQEPVIQLYPPGYQRGIYRYTFEIASPSADEVTRLADRVFAALKPNPRQPPPFESPEFIPLRGTQHSRMQVSFTSSEL